MTAVLAVVVLVITPLLGAPAADAKPRPKQAEATTPYAGYRTPGVKVGAGYLGARQVDGVVVYKIDPGRTATSTTYGAVSQPTARLDGSGRTVTLNDTQRAAWIVSKYGAYRDKVQGAAVELALDDLLVGGPYRLRGTKTRTRLAGLPKAAKIVKLTKVLLAGSRLRAGEFAVTQEVAPTAVVGQPVTSTVRVTSMASDAPVASLPVTFRLPGAAPVTVLTGGDGVATASLVVANAGAQQLVAEVEKVPEDRLLVLTPDASRASRLVVAQQKSTRSVTSTLTATAAIVLANPTLALASDRTDRGLDSFHRATLSMSGSGATTARTASAQLWGPFATKETATCSAKPYGGASSFAAADGTTTLPGGPVMQAGGWFVWGVSVAGDGRTLAAEACGAPVLVHEVPDLLVAGVGQGQQYLTVGLRYLRPGFNGAMDVQFWTAASCSGTSTASASFMVKADQDGSWSDQVDFVNDYRSARGTLHLPDRDVDLGCTTISGS